MAGKTKEYQCWNGKNIDGKSFVGDSDLIQQGARNSKTAEKYDVSGETVAADDLQKGTKYNNKK